MSWLWNSAEKRNFDVMIYEEDYKELCAWVLKKPNIETGGDLFGLWADKHTAVIQLVLGPGKQCTRTTASFYQDIDYLRRVGSYLTQNEGVCHIGEWHSHHQLGLARPSGGDENTVWNNMPTYNLKRFVIFIANIQSSRDSYNVNVGCFLFEIDDQGKHMDVLPGKFTILQKDSPLSGKSEVARERKKGAEQDDENKIAMKELKMNEGGKRPSVTYSKPMRDPKERKRGNRGKQSQLENQNKPNDEESSIDSKKRKMNTKEPISNKIPGSGKKSGEGSPLSEDLENLTINNQQAEENSEEAMEQEQEMGQPVKNSQEEIKHEEQHDSESGKSKGNKTEEIEKDNEASPSQDEQGKTEKEGKQRPLPELPGTETTPEAKTQKQKEDEGQAEDAEQAEDEKQAEDEEQEANRRPAAQSGATTEETLDSKDDPSQGSNKRGKKEEEKISQDAIEEQNEKELQEKKNQEDFKPDEQHDGEEGKSQSGRKEENIKGKAGSPRAEQEKAAKRSKPRVPPKSGKETKAEAKSQKKKDQDKEVPKTRAPQSGTKKADPSQTGSTKSAKKQK